jgi:uncharacterized membrane protein
MATQIQKKPAGQGPVRAARQRTKESWKRITVNAAPEECYRIWRDVSNLARFLSFVDSVLPSGEKWSHWIGKEGDEKTVGWESDLVEDEPGRLLAWRPLAHGPEAVTVSVRFDRASGGRGTIVHLSLERKERADALLADRELHRFKQWKETGEVATTDGQPEGHRGPIERLIAKGEQP